MISWVVFEVDDSQKPLGGKLSVPSLLAFLLLEGFSPQKCLLGLGNEPVIGRAEEALSIKRDLKLKQSEELRKRKFAGKEGLKQDGLNTCNLRDFPKQSYIPNHPQ